MAIELTKTTMSLAAVGLTASAAILTVIIYFSVASGDSVQAANLIRVDEALYSTCDPLRGTVDFGARLAAVVGGKSVQNKNQYPWMVRLVFPAIALKRRSILCGGTLMDDIHILTMGHCVYDGHVNPSGFINTVKSIEVYVGDSDATVDSSAKKLTVEAGFVHPAVINTGVFLNQPDLMVLRLNQSLKNLAGWGNTIRPVCLPAQDEKIPSECKVAGWGLTNHTDPTSLAAQLQSMDVTVHSFPDCLDYKPYSTQKDELSQDFDNATVCSDNEPGADHGFCVGDTGGPLICKPNTTLMQFGIMSIPIMHIRTPCIGPEPGYVMLYISVPYYRGWLRYVAIDALQDVKNTEADLNCARQYCTENLWEVTQAKYNASFQEGVEVLCKVFAGYVYCRRREVKPSRCQTSMVPASLNFVGNLNRHIRIPRVIVMGAFGRLYDRVVPKCPPQRTF